VSTLDDIKIIDADSHVVEPADLWTARMSRSRWGDLVPEVRWDDDSGQEAWFIGDTFIYGAATIAMAGWHEYAPDSPRRLADVDPRLYDPVIRASVMDDYGIDRQVLYPNIGMFATAGYLDVSVDPEFSTECVRAYNDWLVEWCAEAPGRYIPVMSLPFWDLEASEREVARCVEMGHRGVIMSNSPENFDLPTLDAPHWDRLWSVVSDAGIPVNFHIGSGKAPSTGSEHSGRHANFAWMSTLIFQGNARALCALIFGGVCHRFPQLRFVSVESGIGWLPYTLETMDWQWQNSGVGLEHPDYELLPSEYFRRQIYGCFWFESSSALSAIELLGPDNILYETDYPHPTSMSPGPASIAVRPCDYVEATLGALPETTLRKILHDNAAQLYGAS